MAILKRRRAAIQADHNFAPSPGPYLSFASES
jgi:hypothetical protein